MWPLLKRDGLAVQYIATLLLWNRMIGYNPLRLQKKSVVQLLSIVSQVIVVAVVVMLAHFFMQAVYTACVILHVVELLFTPPGRYPDLFPVLNVLISIPVFVLVWLWSIKCGVEISWALGGLPGPSSVVQSKSTNGPSIVIEKESRKGGRVESIGRENGARAMSLGFTQGRRRGPFRPASMGPDVR